MEHDSGTLASIVKVISEDIESDHNKCLRDLKEQIKHEKSRFRSAFKKEHSKMVDAGYSKIKDIIIHSIEENGLRNDTSYLALKKELFLDLEKCIFSNFSKVRKTTKYHKFLRTVESKFKNAEIYGNKADRKIIKRLVPDENILLGLIVKTKSCRINLTFERMWEQNIYNFSERFFKAL